MKAFRRPGIHLLHCLMTAEFADHQTKSEGVSVQESFYVWISSLRARVSNGEAVLRMTKLIQMWFKSQIHVSFPKAMGRNP